MSTKKEMLKKMAEAEAMAKAKHEAAIKEAK